jgi:hypothetical protein
MEAIIGPARERIKSMGERAGKAFAQPDALPLAIASFALGTVVGVLGAVYLPRLRGSRLVEQLGEGLDQAVSTAKETVNTGKEKVKEVVKNVTGKPEEGGTLAPPPMG